MSIEFGVLLLATFFASAVSTTLGFGFGIILISLLQFFIRPTEIVGLSLLVSTISYLLRVIETKSVTTSGDSLRIVLFGMIGVPVGVLLLRMGDPLFLKRYLSVMVLLAAVITVITWRSTFIVQANSVRGRLVQILSAGVGGFMCGSANAGGPPVLFCSVVQRWGKTHAHVVFDRYLLFTSALSVIFMMIFGLYDLATIRVSIGLLPIVWLGVFAGIRLRDKIPEKQSRDGMVLFLLLLAIIGFTNTFL